MKWVKTLLLSAVLFVAPVAASAGLLGGIIGDDVTPVPEPSGALVMGIALTTVALVARRNRK